MLAANPRQFDIRVANFLASYLGLMDDVLSGIWNCIVDEHCKPGGSALWGIKS